VFQIKSLEEKVEEKGKMKTPPSGRVWVKRMKKIS